MKNFTKWLMLIFSLSVTVILVVAQAAEKPLPELKTPRLVVEKSKRRLQVFDGEKLIKTYKIALGFASEGDKTREGDGKTPEGSYRVAVKNSNSKFVVSLGLDYPNMKDAARGLREQRITQNEYDEIATAINENRLPPQKTALGGEIYIHGGGNEKDWTWGCVALEEADIRELFARISVGTTVTIEP